jgi:periplasmic divalent cation tolerance protein
MPTVYVTAPPEAAADIARTLVDERLAACVNRVDCRSTYRWEGTVHDDDEAVLLAKTTDGAFEDLVARTEELHPYDVPCIERFDEDGELSAFAAWRDDAVDV